jgi:hypothetical protein
MMPATMVLPVPGGPANSADSPSALGHLAAEAPVVVDQPAVAHARDELADLGHRVVGQHQLVPGLAPGDAGAERRQLGVEHAAQAVVDVALVTTRLTRAGRRARAVADAPAAPITPGVTA